MTAPIPARAARRRPTAAEAIGVAAAIGSAFFLPSGPVLRCYAVALVVVTLLAIVGRRRATRPRATLPAPRTAAPSTTTSTSTPAASTTRPTPGR